MMACTQTAAHDRVMQVTGRISQWCGAVGRAVAQPRYARWALTVAIAVVATTALAIRLHLVLNAGGLGGIDGYDDGVYYAAAVSLSFGKLPYQDFVLLHPPGLMLVLTPFAGLSRLTSDSVGFESARVFTMLVGALNASLIVIISRRTGLLAATVAGLTYAVWPPAVFSEVTVRLEPMTTLGILIALACLVRAAPHRPSLRALVAAGLALSFAVNVKIWAAAPLVVILWWAWRWWGRRGLVGTSAGLMIGCLAIDAPFWLAAPGQMWRMVVLDQLGRGRTQIDAPARLAHTLLPGLQVPNQWAPGATTTVLALLATAGVAVACWQLRNVWAYLSLLAVTLSVLLLSPTFYSYYTAFAAPFVALLGGTLARRVALRLPRRTSTRPVFAPRELITSGLLMLGLTGAWTASSAFDVAPPVNKTFPAGQLAEFEETSRCVTSDSPDALILTNVLTRNLQRRCQVPVDLSGLTYDIYALPLTAEGRSVPRAANSAWQRYLDTYLLSGQSVFLLRAGDDGLNSAGAHVMSSLLPVAAGRGYKMLQDPPSVQDTPTDRRPEGREQASPGGGSGSVLFGRRPKFTRVPTQLSDCVAEQTDGLVADDDADHQRNRRVQPVEATRPQDQRACDGDGAS